MVVDTICQSNRENDIYCPTLRTDDPEPADSGQYECMVITYSSMDQPGKVVNPARGQLNRKNQYFAVPIHA